jgi:periplasmic protein TonB
MSLVQAYRSQLAAKQRTRLLFCLTVAAIVHLGAIAVGLPFWRQIQSLTSQYAANKTAKTPALEPLDFVYLNNSNTAQPPKTERRSQVNEIAAGQHRGNAPVSAGKAGAAAKSQPIAPAPPAPAAPPAAQPAPPIASSEPNRQPVAPAPAVNAPPSPDRTNLAPALPPIPQSTPHPEIKAESLPVPQPVRPVSPPKPAPTNTSPAPSPISRPSTISSRPAAPPSNPRSSQAQPSRQQVATAAQLGGPVSRQASDQSGQGLDGQLNSNRTAIGSAGVDATRDDIWGPYIAELNRRIDQSWQRISLDKGRRAEVKFVVDRQGQLAQLQLVRSSGDDEADRSALRAVQISAPFDPLPQGATENYLIVNINFNYHVEVSP